MLNCIVSKFFIKLEDFYKDCKPKLISLLEIRSKQFQIHKHRASLMNNPQEMKTRFHIEGSETIKLCNFPECQ
jgi:hypothetical protein